MSWLSKEDLKKFKHCGENVLVSKDALIFGHENISIGDNVRIDAFNLILASSGYMNIGNFIHLAARSTYLCSGGITLMDFAQVSMNCTLLSASDDFSGDYLIGPTVPENNRLVYKSHLRIEEHSVIGIGSVLSPGTIMNSGSALGGLSMTKRGQELEHDSIYIGNPARFLKKRTRLNRELALNLHNNNP